MHSFQLVRSVYSSLFFNIISYHLHYRLVILNPTLVVIIITYLFEGRQIFSSFMRGQELMPGFERVIKNSDMLIQIRLVPHMTNTLPVVHKILKDMGILHRRCCWHLEVSEK